MTSTDRYEPDDWTPDGRKISDPSQFETIRQELERRGPVILKHWHYRGARSPTHVDLLCRRSMLGEPEPMRVIRSVLFRLPIQS